MLTFAHHLQARTCLQQKPFENVLGKENLISGPATCNKTDVMQFLYPTFLIAALAVAIPVIIHLFYFRRFKKVYFTNVRFLKEVKEETSARQKLRNLLVLLMRCLAVLALVFAFAQPFIPQGTAVKQGDNALSIYVDNSFSMQSLSEDVPLIEKAKQKAREIVNGYREEDRFQILTNDFEGRHQRLLSKEEALAMVDEIKPSPAVRTLSQVLTRQKQVLSTSTAANRLSFIISDFQKNITDLSNFQDTTLSVNLVPLQSVQENNISIDSAWFETPVRTLNQPNVLFVKTKNWGNNDVENVRLSVTYSGETKPVGTLQIPAGAEVLDTVVINISQPGWHEAVLQVTDYPVQFDDSYLFAFHVSNFIDVLVINELAPDPHLEAAFKSAGIFRVTNQLTRNLDYSTFPSFQLILCNGVKSFSSGLSFELAQYVKNGGNLLVFPPHDADLTSWNAFLKSVSADEIQAFEKVNRQVADINTEEFVFRDVFENLSANLRLPSTQGNFKIGTSAHIEGERLLTYRDGSTFLSKYPSGNGFFYLCAAPLNDEYSNLTSSGEIFVPMLFKMAISAARSRPIAYTIGTDEVIEFDDHHHEVEAVYKLRSGDTEFIPQQRIVASKVYLTLQNENLTNGFYDLFLHPDTILAKFAFNYDRRESDLRYYSLDDLEEMLPDNMQIISANALADLSEIISERNTGILLWKWFVILALLALAAESLLLRFWKG